MAIGLKQQQPAQPVDEIAGTTQPKQPNDLVAIVLDPTGAQQQNEVQGEVQGEVWVLRFHT
jgi:hypothetical protein